MSRKSVADQDRESRAAVSGGDYATTAIVPTFNRAALVEECLGALLSQSLPPAQIVVVNDGSDDNTAEALHRFGDAIDILTMTNRGKSAGVNAALSLARHHLIWIVDDDDLVLPSALEILTDLIRKAPEAGFAYGRYDRFIVDPQSGHKHVFDTGYWRECAPEEFLAATLEDFFVHHPGMLVRRSLYQRAGPFKEGLARSQDYDMLIRLARLAKPVTTDATLFYQRQHDGPRGIARQPFAADEREGRWIEADKEILLNCYKTFELSEYLSSRRIDSLADKRRALLQRGTVMARKKLWDLALDDCEAAAVVADTGLSGTEKGIIKRAVLSKYGCDELLLDRRISQRVQAIGRHSGTGRQIAGTLARGLLWRIRKHLRDGNLLSAAKFARLSIAWSFQPPSLFGRIARSNRPADG